jgi:predicted dehydrogenase
MTLRVGLIGLGTVGKVHAAAYPHLKDARFVAVADASDAALATLDPALGVATYRDARQMLDEAKPDIVCIATPAATHEALTLLAAERGVQVLVEKPIALTPESARRMIDGCRAAGVRLFYGSTYRFLPAVRRARALVQEGLIGEVVLMREQALGGKGPETQPMGEHHYPVGSPGGFPMGLVDHGIHLMDVFAWTTGRKVTGGHGRGNRTGQPMVTEFLQLTYEGGAIGELVYNECTYPTELPNEGLFTQGDGWDVDGYVKAGGWIKHPSSYHLYGTKGSLRVFHYANLLFHFTAAGVRQIPLEGAPPPDHFRAQMQAFVDDVRQGRPATTPGEVGLATLETMLLAYR